MSIDDYSANPDENTEISDIFIGEQCPPGNVNDAIRQLMADIKAFKNQGATVDPSSVVSTDIGNAIGLGDDGKLYIEKFTMWPLVFTAPETDELYSVVPPGATGVRIESGEVTGSISGITLNLENLAESLLVAIPVPTPVATTQYYPLSSVFRGKGVKAGLSGYTGTGTVALMMKFIFS